MHRGRTEPRPAKAPPRFKVGDIVAVTGSAGVLLPKHEERALLDARFEITRQLPEREHRFHYRIRNTLTGQERAVSEAGLREASCSSSATPELGGCADSAELAPISPDSIASPSHGDDLVEALPPSVENKLSLPRPARAAPGRAR